MKIRIVEVSDKANIILPLPTNLLKELQWKDGDELELDIPCWRGYVPNHITISRKQDADTKDL